MISPVRESHIEIQWASLINWDLLQSPMPKHYLALSFSSIESLQGDKKQHLWLQRLLGLKIGVVIAWLLNPFYLCGTLEKPRLPFLKQLLPNDKDSSTYPVVAPTNSGTALHP